MNESVSKEVKSFHRRDFLRYSGMAIAGATVVGDLFAAPKKLASGEVVKSVGFAPLPFVGVQDYVIVGPARMMASPDRGFSSTGALITVEGHYLDVARAGDADLFLKAQFDTQADGDKRFRPFNALSYSRKDGVAQISSPSRFTMKVVDDSLRFTFSPNKTAARHLTTRGDANIPTKIIDGDSDVRLSSSGAPGGIPLQEGVYFFALDDDSANLDWRLLYAPVAEGNPAGAWQLLRNGQKVDFDYIAITIRHAR